MLTRNEQVVRSNRISSSKVKSPKSGFTPGFSGIFVWLGKSLSRGDVGVNYPHFPESFFEMQVKMQVKKGREMRGSARVSTGFFEVGIQTIYFLFLKFFIEGGIDAQRDRDVLVAHLIAGGHDVHTGEVH